MHIDNILNEIEQKIRGLANRERDPEEGYDHIRQETALRMARRHSKGVPNTVPIAIVIAQRVACDMITKQKAYRRRFRSFTDCAAMPDVEQDDKTFCALWEAVCCPHLTNIAKTWWRSLRPQEQRVLRGLRRGMTQAQVAEREGIPPGTVAAWAHRSRHKLEAMLSTE